MSLAGSCATYWTGTELVALSRSYGALLAHRTGHTVHHHINQMSTIQLTINGNQIQGEVDQIVEILSKISNTVTTPIVPTIEEEPEDLLPFNEFTIKMIAPIYGDQLAQQIVDKLEECRTHFSGFNHFKGMYLKCSGIEQRQLMKTVSAVYRYKFAKFHREESKSSLKSQIKWDTKCPHCGAFANAFVLRLIQEGLWTV